MDMRWNVRAMRVSVGMLGAVMLMALAACSGSSSGDAASQATPDSPENSAAIEANADRAACADVQKVFLQLAAATSHWKPEQHPFDATVATVLAPLVPQLRDLARSASTTHLKVVVDRNADALGALEEAIVSHRPPMFRAALRQTRNAYAALPSCAQRNAKPHQALASPSGTATEGSAPSGGATASPSAPPAAVLKYARDPGCVQARKVYASLKAITDAWNEQGDPFDATAAAGFRTTASGLLKAAKAAKAPVVRERAQANGAAFSQLAAAMKARDLTRVNNSVATMQQTAVSLALICPVA